MGFDLITKNTDWLPLHNVRNSKALGRIRISLSWEMRKGSSMSQPQDAEIRMPSNEPHKRALELIENLTMNADQVQSQVLSAILLRNADTEYLRRYHLDGRTDRQSFKKCLPVIVYEDVLPDILRVADGDTSPILCIHPISEFYASSGTSSGKRKLIPAIHEEADRRALFFSFRTAIINRYFQGLNKGKAMLFTSVRPETKTPGGLPVRPFLTSYYKSRQFKEQYCDPCNQQSSPLEVILCCDPQQSMYSHLLCGLLQNAVVLGVGAPFPTALIKAMHFLERHWKSLCHDIRTGTLNSMVTDSSVQEAVRKELHPNPQLADFVQAECSKGSWEGIIPRLWPNARYIHTIVTGSMAQYIPMLDYYSADLPLVSSIYASSEGLFGINLSPLCSPREVAYTFMPNTAYFEFLPLHPEDSNCPPVVGKCDQNTQRLLDLTEVKVGEEYELVVTTYTGLYRYRMGDVLRVAGFHNATPQFQIVRRREALLSIDAEKTDEVDLQNAVKKAVEHLKPFDAGLVEYTSLADTTAFPGHYVLYWELQIRGGPLPASVLEDCCATVEECLNFVYKMCRVRDNTIGPLEIRVVQVGTFDQVMDYACANMGASLSQYKLPKCVKLNTPIVELLNSKVTRVYFGPTFLKWQPHPK